MSAASAKTVYELITEVRACFRELRALSDAMHQGIGVTTAMRAVMEHVAEGGPATVPDIARAKQVSRQNIQVLVDALGALGLVSARANPGHRKSPLIALTGRGRRTFGEMRDREQALLAAIARDLPKESIPAALAALGALQRGAAATNRTLPTNERSAA